jgi:hypothetical protein
MTDTTFLAIHTATGEIFSEEVPDSELDSRLSELIERGYKREDEDGTWTWYAIRMIDEL